MTVKTDHFSKRQIDKIGSVLRTTPRGSDAFDSALADLNDWRELHLGIMNSYYSACRKIAERTSDPDIIVAARLKRMPTILDKIKRLPTLHLSQLQDVAGIRIVVKDIPTLEKVSQDLMELSPKSVKDYIAAPKLTGYRGRHYIYSEDGMLVEVQLRTFFQHLWATTLETIDFFRGTAMKTRPDANNPWQEFFELTSSIYASIEDKPVLPQHSDFTTEQILQKLQATSKKHNIFEQILTYADTKILNDDDLPDGTFYVILNTDIPGRKITYLHYMEDEYSRAVDDYEKMEKINQGNLVLISVQNLKKVQAAYPNYFLNLREFVKYIEIAIEKESKI